MDGSIGNLDVWDFPTRDSGDGRDRCGVAQTGSDQCRFCLVVDLGPVLFVRLA